MTMKLFRFTQLWAWLAVATLAALFFVWPVTHTTGIRNALLVLCLLQFGVLVFRKDGPRLLSGLAIPVRIYLALIVWLLVVALFISDHTVWSLKEIHEDWLKVTLALVLGLLVGVASSDSLRTSRYLVAGAIIAALELHVIYIDITGILQWARIGQMPARLAGFSEHVGYSNNVVLMLLTLLLAEAYSRLNRRRGALAVPNWVFATILGAGIVALVFAWARNGIVELSCVLGVLIVLYWREHRSSPTSRRRLGVAMLFGAGALLAAVWGFIEDPRTSMLFQDIPIALDTATHKAWLDQSKYPLPKHADGTDVSHSNYMRIAWAKEGIILVLEKPLGVGYGRDAFGRALRTKGGGDMNGSSHSGWLDLAIGAGIPGVLLWCMFLASVAHIGLRRYRSDGSVYGLALLLVTVGFSIRMLVDSVNYDHVFQQFMFVTGLLTMWSLHVPVHTGLSRPTHSTLVRSA
jgi:hypothetical protein